MDENGLSEIKQGFSLGQIILPDMSLILARAYVPEHSVRFMRAMSTGEPFLVNDYLFLAAEDWLMAIGYPLQGDFDPSQFEGAVKKAVQRTRPVKCWSVSPELPPALSGSGLESDQYYILRTSARVQPRLLRLAERAAGSLQVEYSRSFTPEHQRMWDEFVQEKDLSSRVRSMFDRTMHVLAGVHDLTLLNAWDEKGRLAACLLLDHAPYRFTSYLIGARSRSNYTPYATDLLFREMLASARRQNKEYIHLGLGVNPGIRRFKTKWGGEPVWSFEMAYWQEKRSYPAGVSGDRASPEPFMEDKHRFFLDLPEQRKLAMLWELEKKGRKSWIAGAAHFCRCSFRLHMRRLFEEVDTVLCEGPLDRVSMDFIADIGKNPDPDSTRLASLLTEPEILELERTVLGPKGFWAALLNMNVQDGPDVRYHLAHTRHWLAFFAMWSGFLRRHGWDQSVDMEAWNTARDMDKYVLGMETIAEQLATLESIPVERIISFFRDCRNWGKLMKRFEKGYLKGKLEFMFGSSVEFPSRTEMVINRRDERFLHRMLPFLEQGRCAVFVGTAHMLNLRHMLRTQGFSLKLCS